MNDVKKISALAFLGLFVFACSQQESNYMEEISLNSDTQVEQEKVNNEAPTSGVMVWSEENQTYEVKEKENVAVISSEGLTNPYKDKKFIKTANLAFSVKDVYQSSVAIEEILIANNGFLINSNLYTETFRHESYVKNKEWLVEVKEFETRNNITIRVPNENLHNTLVQIAKEIEFLDSRYINADDMGLKLLAEELEQKRNKTSAANIQKQITTGGKLEDKIYGEEMAFQKQMQKDISLLKELSIEDQISYSTITIAIYQSAEISTKEVPNYEQFREQYKESFAQKLGNAFQNSIELIKASIEILFTIWPVILLLIFGFVIYKRKFGQKE